MKRRKKPERTLVERVFDEVVEYGGIPTRKWDLYRHLREGLGLREPHMAFGWMMKPAVCREPWVRYNPDATDELLGEGWERLPTWGSWPVHAALTDGVAVCGQSGPFLETDDPVDCPCCVGAAR